MQRSFWAGTPVLVLALFCLATAGCPNQLELKRKSETRYKIAEDAYARGEYATAVIELERALELNSKNAEAHHLMGLYYMIARSDVATAEKHLKAAIAHGEGVTVSKAKNSLGNLYLNAGRLDQAITLFEDALSDIHYYKDSWAAEGNLGRALFAKGDLDGAQSHLDRALVINPRYCAGYFYRGELWTKKGDPEKAVRDYTWATTKDSSCKGFTEAHYRAARTYLELKKNVEAAAAFAACATSAPGTDRAEDCKKTLKAVCIDPAAAATAACGDK